jgi:hypothetical protein
VADRLALQELLAGTSRAGKGVEGQALSLAHLLGGPAAGWPSVPSPLSLHALPCFPQATGQQPHQLHRRWSLPSAARSGDSVSAFAITAGVCVRVLCAVSGGEGGVVPGPCGCIACSSAAVLFKSGTRRSLRLTLAKVFADSKV